MKPFGWQIKLGVILIVLSAVVYFIHYLIFRDPHHIFIYMIGDIAFVFIEVLLVTLIIHQVLSEREKRTRLEKLNMVIGAFFSEVGTELLTYLSDFDPKLDKIRKDLIVTDEWSDREFVRVDKRLRNYDYGVEIQKVLLRLLENPNLLEHESFTNLLQAVFHLTEELAHRDDIRNLPATDYEHLDVDVRRIYTLMVHQWLDYMKHLKDNYPHLFSLAMRTNPFDQNASPIVK
ncbi:MAG: hypothetical protein A7315_12955 [Candidatus Altiarchaeales archaeon WOR_SM1_79]|nr:MAG: hypothetical protein A7315_12955 [Candidatus Altiarchaeales archaeon WOR_SM1_79]